MPARSIEINVRRPGSGAAVSGDVEHELRALANPRDAAFLQRFFKTGPGQYGEGDRFLGIRVPQLRRLVRRFRELPREQVLMLLQSTWHEQRLIALLLLVEQYKCGTEAEREAICRAYLDNTRYVNNWDLVDSSAEHIMGPRHGPGNLRPLEELARSESIWERRIAMLATFHWIKQGEFRPALHVAKLLLSDDHDLIHKAVGWMLREIGKRDLTAEERFLRRHYHDMPRTALRYATERLPEERRRQYLRGKV
jgi:3-methyladenine DNA glycosylase AlkD